MRKNALGETTAASGPVAHPVVDWGHFDMVAQATERFGNYMQHATQMSDADRARIDATRADKKRNAELAQQRQPYIPSITPPADFDMPNAVPRAGKRPPTRQTSAPSAGVSPSPQPSRGSSQITARSSITTNALARAKGSATPPVSTESPHRQQYQQQHQQQQQLLGSSLNPGGHTAAAPPRRLAPKVATTRPRLVAASVPAKPPARALYQPPNKAAQTAPTAQGAKQLRTASKAAAANSGLPPPTRRFRQLTPAQAPPLVPQVIHHDYGDDEEDRDVEGQFYEEGRGNEYFRLEGVGEDEAYGEAYGDVDEEAYGEVYGEGFGQVGEEDVDDVESDEDGEGCEGGEVDFDD